MPRHGASLTATPSFSVEGEVRISLSTYLLRLCSFCVEYFLRRKPLEKSYKSLSHNITVLTVASIGPYLGPSIHGKLTKDVNIRKYPQPTSTDLD